MTVSDEKQMQAKQTALYGEGLQVTIIGSVVNVLLIIFKLWAGTVAHSQALLADGIHSLSDLFSDFVVILGLKWGRKLADEDHQFGHARIETISAMVVGILLVAVGGGIAYSAMVSIYQHNASEPSLFAIFAALVSVLLKEGMFWYTLTVGKKIKSMALIGNAWHHRSDALSSVAVFIGVGAVYYNPDWYLADSYAALLVTFFVAKIGINLIWTAFKELSDTAPDRHVLAQFAITAGTVEGVRQVHDMRARHSGSQIFVEIHIVVDPDQSVREGHKIARTVKRTLLDEFADVTHVIIHVDPELKSADAV